jgi:hypothetical protein
MSRRTLLLTCVTAPLLGALCVLGGAVLLLSQIP